MFKLVGDRPQCNSLGLCLGLTGSCPVSKGTGNLNYFRNPATVFFLVEFNRQNHKNLNAAILPFQDARYQGTSASVPGVRLTPCRSAASGAHDCFETARRANAPRRLHRLGHLVEFLEGRPIFGLPFREPIRAASMHDSGGCTGAGELRVLAEKEKTALFHK